MNPLSTQFSTTVPSSYPLHSIDPEQYPLALQAAAKTGQLEMIRLLLDSGVNPLTLNGEGYSPVDLACREGHLEIVKEYVERKLIHINEPKNSHKQTLLWIASSNGKVKIVKWLLGQGAVPSTTDNEGYAPLYMACKKAS